MPYAPQGVKESDDDDDDDAPQNTCSSVRKLPLQQNFRPLAFTENSVIFKDSYFIFQLCAISAIQRRPAKTVEPFKDQKSKGTF
jgi:hypothetical protein